MHINPVQVAWYRYVLAFGCGLPIGHSQILLNSGEFGHPSQLGHSSEFEWRSKFEHMKKSGHPKINSAFICNTLLK
jgi:hypothetical protein